MTAFSQKQREFLLKPIEPVRVSQDGKGFSHLEAYEVKAHLTRIFGFEGWSTRIDGLSCIFEDEVEWTDRKTSQVKNGWDVGYLCSMTLSIFAGGECVTSFSDASTDVASHQPTKGDAHDLAVKSAVSGALKRCATALGDQFGLSLYRKGSTDALVRWVIPYKEQPTQEQLL
jgi:recombination DNA repair RAD52 pathway protein